MTNVMQWLQALAPEIGNLSKDELSAIADFSLLWSLFESRVLNSEGNVRNICDKVRSWYEAGNLDADAFDPELSYFRDRYYADGTFTNHFSHLHFRKPDREDLVRAVIVGSDNDPQSRLAANLIIVFRYRNNLFHGTKWNYNLQGQLKNFNTANALLMKVLERYGALGEG